jgi:hypothetical protein
LLVDDGADSYPTAGTVGTTFSWGSFEDNQLVKTGGTTKLKAYNFQREMEFGNTYEWIGRTRAPAEYIESVSKLKSAYSKRNDQNVLVY